MDLISVIVPVYNVEKYLRQCVDGIINQTYKNLEIILINDGSTDSSGKICDEYAKKDNRIKVIHQKNAGVSATRNKGVRIANGAYISFIDSDDVVAPNFIERLYNLLVEANADIAECDFARFENYLPNSNLKKADTSLITSNEMQKRLYMEEVSMRTVVLWTKLYKKKLYDGLQFPNGMINEDEALIHKIINNATNGIVLTDEKLYFYRYNNESIMGRKYNGDRILGALHALKDRKEFYREIKNNELYNINIIDYQERLKNYYIKTKDNIINSRKFTQMIIKEYRKNYREYIFLKNIKLRNKIKYTLFYFSPNSYYVLVKLIRKIKKER